VSHTNDQNASGFRKPTRRQTMQWVMAAVAASSLPKRKSFGAAPVEKKVGQQEAGGKQPPRLASEGYGVDPKLTTPHSPGDFWPLILTDTQKRTAKALADVILPKDDLGPAASELGVVEMIDEWVSAPYPQQMGDRPVITNGLDWMEAEAHKRFNKSFADLDESQHHGICDDICYAPKAKRQFKKAAEFFSRFRSLAAGAYYATPPGWKAIGYIGNIPLGRFDGPPPEVLKQLGVEQTVD